MSEEVARLICELDLAGHYTADVRRELLVAELQVLRAVARKVGFAARLEHEQGPVEEEG